MVRFVVSCLCAAMGLCCLSRSAPAQEAETPFGRFAIVDEVACGDPGDPHALSQHPENVSTVETLLGEPCRVLPPAGEAKYFAYRLGAGKGLQAGATYILEVDYPEDVARSIWIENRGCETNLGFATGAATGDVVVGRYVHLNPESLNYPLSGRF